MAHHPLLAELAEIDRTLLSSVTTEPPDQLRADERTLTRAYLLLAHAVLEERIENIFLAHFHDARAVIRASDPVPAALLPFFAAALEWGAATHPPTYHKRKWLEFMASSLAEEHVAKVVRDNHGLKADNVRDLARLVGIEWKEIDDAQGVEMGALTTLGVKRGAAGHTSPFSAPTKTLDGQEYPVNVREWVNQAAITVIGLETVITQLSKGGEAKPSSNSE